MKSVCLLVRESLPGTRLKGLATVTTPSPAADVINGSGDGSQA